MILTTILLVVVVLVPAIVLHECAHGWVAYRLGDPTAKRMGRLTLNPLKHIDPVGTVLVPLALYLLHVFGLNSSLFMFGWAKPVPVNFRALSNPRRDQILVALAGPGVNLLAATLIAQLAKLGSLYMISEILYWGVLTNVALAVFNLIPIPPLDGSRVVGGLLPENLERIYSRLEPFGIIVVIVLINLRWLDFIGPVIEGIIRWMGV
ncbi:MAG: site-2 protease family protein [Candidatus Omnitrophica bacterium]|nr:site-2 protease family protein [Candidatus Omnitrophota bacterium]